jgi:hypothetical protein
MKASTNSWHARLYKWTYDSELSSSLCPYFWKILIAVLWFIPSVILSIPIIVLDKVQKSTVTLDPQERNILGFVIWLLSIGCTIALIGVITMFGAIFGLVAWNSLSMAVALLICVAMPVLFIMCLIRRSEYRSEKKPNIFTEFIKAKYNNYCPKIDWKDEAKDKE